jgi:hypothetical protein
MEIPSEARLRPVRSAESQRSWGGGLDASIGKVRLAKQNRSAVLNAINLESAAERRRGILDFSTPGKT